jgi:hypothetical protein
MQEHIHSSSTEMHIDTFQIRMAEKQSLLIFAVLQIILKTIATPSCTGFCVKTHDVVWSIETINNTCLGGSCTLFLFLPHMTSYCVSITDRQRL